MIALHHSDSIFWTRPLYQMQLHAGTSPKRTKDGYCQNDRQKMKMSCLSRRQMYFFHTLIKREAAGVKTETKITFYISSTEWPFIVNLTNRADFIINNCGTASLKS